MAGAKKTKLDTAVIAAAGYGSRLLPMTLHQPKAMMAVADRPLIHYVVDQLAAGGVRNFIVVINPAFQAVRKYIDYQLQQKEWAGCRFAIIEKKSASFADSVLAADGRIGKKHFIAVACDDLIDDSRPPFASLAAIFNRYHQPIVVVREISRKDIPNYGVIAGTAKTKDIWSVADVVEKPKPAKAPSKLGAISVYILPPEIFRFIKLTQKIHSGPKEVTVIDVLKLYLKEGGHLLGWVFRGQHFDGGSRLGLLKASIYYGAKHPAFGQSFKKYLRSL